MLDTSTNIEGDWECLLQKPMVIAKFIFFVKEGYHMDIIVDTPQQLTVKIHDLNLNKDFFATAVCKI